jgi:hypothetical protein
MLSRLPTTLSLYLLVSVSSVDAVPYDFNFLDNYRRPIPSPEEGPPASYHASRNKGLIPAQVCAIVGAYVLTVLIWGVLLLTVGRRMRRKTENVPKELELVTARPSGRTPASPLSARSATSWFKKGFKSKPHDSAVGSPLSPALNSPGSFDQKIIDAQRERDQADMERLYAAVMEHDKKKSYSHISAEETELSDRKPSSIDTTRQVPNFSNPSSPVKAIYPPGYHNGPPTAPLPRDRLRDQQPPASPRSILSKKSHTSQTSTASKGTRFNLKNLRISGPVQRYPGEGTDDEARTPLSPRFYNPGAPPSPPTQQNSPTTPGDLEQAYAYEVLDEPQPLPRPAPQRGNSSQLNTPTGPPAKSATSSNNSLPLRGFAEPLKSPDLRTTVLDRRIEKLTAQTPKTGVPFTPYSPYTPFTPITPVTPHLVTRKERKRDQKESRRMRTVKEDMVQSPKEIFGDAY